MLNTNQLNKAWIIKGDGMEIAYRIWCLTYEEALKWKEIIGGEVIEIEYRVK